MKDTSMRGWVYATGIFGLLHRFVEWTGAITGRKNLYQRSKIPTNKQWSCRRSFDLSMETDI